MKDSGIEAVKEATVARFREIAAQYQDLQIEADNLQRELTRVGARQEELSQMAHRCYVTAELFGFDLVTAASAVAHREASAETLSPSPPPPPPPPPPATLSRPKSIRDFVLEAAERAYPNAVRASELRKRLEQQGGSIHEKTIGMTLYRLSRDGTIRREGKADWFFVPPDQRNAEAAEESPGEDAPGGQPRLIN